MEKEQLLPLLEKIIPSDRIKARYLDLIAYASDASFYHLVPQAVVQPMTVAEVRSLFKLSNDHLVPLTFRCGGTSLSGQSITDGILVDLSKFWRMVKVESEGQQVRFQPGVIGSLVNHSLKKYKRKMGPDPSSISSAMMGGILANNSSGMCCGVTYNSYHTLKSMTILLPNGQQFNTENKEDYQRFENECPELYQKLLALKSKIVSNDQLTQSIKAKYKLKNTVGYNINSFLDYEHPLDILSHLMIGSEGTLAFIAEAVLNTIPDFPYKSTGFLYFENIYTACSAIGPLKESGAEALELMDRAALRSIEMVPGVPAELLELPDGAAALLCEYQANTPDELDRLVENGVNALKGVKLLYIPEFTIDVYQQEFYWKLRKGMFPSVGAVRKQGTTVILEDIAFPIESLADAVNDLQKLFIKHEYDNAIIFGHAKDGNIHFVVSQTFNVENEIQRYAVFMDEVVDLVVNKYHGTLKAEHGTGRNMAPFVKTEWGPEAYAIMKEVKQILDPKNMLNPGVIINEDAKAHLKNLKKMPVVEAEVDKCIECGYCEHRCPSRDITMTPRQRIVVRREVAKLKEKKDFASIDILMKEYQYDGMDTCAVDGLCATVCPVDINTGELIKRLRRENHSDMANKMAMMAAKNFKALEGVVKFLLRFGNALNKLFGFSIMTFITKFFKKIIPAFPLWTKQLTKPVNIKTQHFHDAEVVYFPTCISRMMGASVNGKEDLLSTFLNVSKKANIKVNIPQNITGHCCGQAFSSKGFNKAAAEAMNKTINSIWQWTDKGKIPVVLDVSSCTQVIRNCRAFLEEGTQKKFDQLKFMDSIDYAADVLVPRLNIQKKKESVVLHPVCSLVKMKLDKKFKQVASACAHNVDVPFNAGCCGMAGDRGFLFPELTKSAVKPEVNEVSMKKYDGYYSSAKTCEMAVSEEAHKNYESILYLLDEVSE